MWLACLQTQASGLRRVPRGEGLLSVFVIFCFFKNKGRMGSRCHQMVTFVESGRWSRELV